MRRHAIKFMADEWFFNKVKRYAKYKGFTSGGAFARYAVMVYMKRSPLKEHLDVFTNDKPSTTP